MDSGLGMENNDRCLVILSKMICDALVQLWTGCEHVELCWRYKIVQDLAFKQLVISIHV